MSVVPPPHPVQTRLASLATSGVMWGFLVSALFTVWVLLGLGGREYYGTALAVRAYEPAHRLLRPSGPAGQSFGLVGTVLMVMPFAYMARKRVSAMKGAGALKHWLQLHLFCGIAGPVLVTFHTSFKFNGLIAAAYWSMVTVMLSGFVGRYLFVRIPRSIRGNELTRAELDERAHDLHDQLALSVASDRLMQEVEAFEATVVPADASRRSLAEQLTGDVLFGRRLRAFVSRLEAEGVSPSVREEIAGVTRERVRLLRALFHLERTKELFQLWHVFHLPLVYLLLVIAAAHIALALYMGYVPFRWS
ncbi:MAG: hypothetical protein ABL982_12340 [Vicinamibacterales bacterium]